MSFDVELERKKLQFKRMEMAISELEFSILEKMSDVDRMKIQNELNKEKLEELRKEINK